MSRSGGQDQLELDLFQLLWTMGNIDEEIEQLKVCDLMLIRTLLRCKG